MMQPLLKTTVLAAALVISIRHFCNAHQIPLTGGARNQGLPSIEKVSDAQWRALNNSVGGRLFTNEPLGLPCYDEFNGDPVRLDLAECMEAVINSNNMSYLSSHPAGYAQVCCSILRTALTTQSILT